MIRDERLLRSRLADVFLDLVIDDENELAFTRPAETGNASTPTVLRTERLTFIDTVMLLALRQRLLRAQPGERVMVDLDELREQLELYRTCRRHRPGRLREARQRVVEEARQVFAAHEDVDRRPHGGLPGVCGSCSMPNRSLSSKWSFGAFSQEDTP